MRPARRFLLCQTISVELQRVITRYSREERFNRADFCVKLRQEKAMTFFLKISAISAPSSRTLEIVARTSGTSKFFQKKSGYVNVVRIY